MESPAPTPRSRNADRSSMFRFFRSLVGSKRGLKRSDGTLLGGQECPSQEQMMHRQGIRVHFAQALEVEQRATGPLGVSPEALAMEEQCLLDGELRRASLKVGATPWNHILALYKQFQKLAMAKLPLEEESEEEEMEEEDSSFKLCVPVTFQSPLHKTFRPIDTVGFVESELKKLLVAQQESRRRKMGSHEGWEPLVPPEITLEGIMGDQGLLLEEMDDLGNWPPSE
ncbi:gametogenetin-binding protein 1-like [Eptesicus fuscus]|uniref:gametogenetin-binding protein 1-like n=1 Tax=Eptesicus fuscus TaxID=29078 RepID=UPI0024041EB7|nr:gametogenetin-binding protein 1-like [Eptesicus fuscus]